MSRNKSGQPGTPHILRGRALAGGGFVFALALSACGVQPQQDSVLPQAAECVSGQSATQRLLAFGDSQTEGISSQQDGCRFSFAYVLADGLGLSLTNRAKGGSTLSESGAYGPSQLDQIAGTEFRPDDTVVWLIDFNDVLRYGTDPTRLARFRTTLAEALSLLSAQTQAVWIAPAFRAPAQSAEAHAAYAEAVADAVEAAAANVHLIPTDALFLPSAEDFLPDATHLSPGAQTRLGQILTAYILSEGGAQ